MTRAGLIRERTIGFYEVVADNNGGQQRMQQLPWDDMLAATAISPINERTFEGDHTFVGTTVTCDEEDHLLLHRVKERTEWLSIVDWATGEIRDLEQKANEGYLDTSIMCFLPFGNVVAIMQGSLSSPSRAGLQAWLNGLKFFSAQRLAVRPVVSYAQVEKLRTAQGASRVEIRIGRSKADALRNHHGRLARMLNIASEDYGDIDVTMIISVPRGKGRAEDRERLLNDLRDIDDVVPGTAERARATLVYAEDGGPEHRQLAELVDHYITAKRRVSVVDEQGDALRILSAVNVILEAAAEHEKELRLAVDAV